MLHKDVYGWFAVIFPQYTSKVETYFPCGKNCIRVRLRDHQEFVFTYESLTDWSLDTVDSFIRRLKGV